MSLGHVLAAAGLALVLVVALGLAWERFKADNDQRR